MRFDIVHCYCAILWLRHTHDVLHWLPVPHFCVRGAGPAYFQQLCIPMVNHSHQPGLCPAEHGDLAMPRKQRHSANISFSIAAPVIWNSHRKHFCSSLPSSSSRPTTSENLVLLN